MQFFENYSLFPFNTFHINVKARLLARLQHETDVSSLLQSAEFKNSGRRLWLGGGSNVLFTGDFDGLVVKNELKGRSIVEETDQHVILKVGSGEDWHETVRFAIENNWSGIENLSLIPGTIGAAPMQNIGAYGVELKDVFHELEAVNLTTGKNQTFKNQDCEFGYRTSIFKTKLKDNMFIESVSLKLSKVPHFNLSYRPLHDFFKDTDIANITLKDVSDAVIQIRESKLPDPKDIGNGGSFFKNPTLGQMPGKMFLEKYPEAPYYQNEDGSFKIPAAYLIQECDWKGKRVGDAGVHHLQPLVLVNHGNASGTDILNLAKSIQKSVFEKFHIKLEPEVNIF